MPITRFGRAVALILATGLLAARPGSAVPDSAAFFDHCLHRLGADHWHAAGLRGKGTIVAVLDTGFPGYSDHLGGALPRHVVGRSFRIDGNLEAGDSPHGIMVAEVVHAIAPEAEILLENWEPDSPRRYLDAVRWARHQGARLLVCSVVMPSWSDGEGGGAIHAEIARLLGDEALFVVCAGNLARRQWTGDFQAGPGHWHSWQGADLIDNLVLPWDDRPVTVELNWRGSARYELLITDWSDHVEVGRTQGVSAGESRLAMVRFLPRSGHSYTVRVRWLSGATARLKLVVLGGGLGVATERGSITFPGDGPEMLTVGAVDENGQREDYSSCGPCSPGLKPDCVASVPVPSRVRPIPFTGTSAAAPQVAGVAALVWGRHLDWSAGRVRAELLGACRDLGGPRTETGHGLIRLPETGE